MFPQPVMHEGYHLRDNVLFFFKVKSGVSRYRVSNERTLFTESAAAKRGKNS